MKIVSSRFGEFEVPDDRAIRIPDGLLGLPDSRHFVVVEIDDESPYFWVQSADEPELAFLATTPWLFYPDYEFEISDAVQSELEVSTVDDVQVVVLLTVHRNGDDVSALTANLLGPIVVNTESRLGKQLVLDSSAYSTQEALVS
jgi:flagellar assembly factor FliW